MRSKHYILTQFMLITFQGLLYFLLFISFFSILSITNPSILNLTRTAATTMATFVVILAILTIVYGGYDIINKKSRSVFSSIMIATLFSDIVTYFQLQIMNVNPANPEANASLILFGEDFLLLLLILLLQIGLIYFFVNTGYKLYHRINPPRGCCIITSSQELSIHVAEKIATFRRKFKLCDVVHYECPDVQKTIEAYDVIFLAGIPDTEEAQLQNFCYSHNKTTYLLAELEDVIISSAQQQVIDDTPFLYIHRVEPTPMQRFVKRAVDIIISVLGLIITSPIMLIASLFIFCADQGPIFFRQKRATLNGKVFEIIKFRTMYQEDARAANPYSATEDDYRITPVGKVLRKYRIDELPQLYNVLRGEMSIVGPRPEMLENVTKYEQEVPEFKYRQQMKAGLTGLAQIDGKYNTSPKDKAILDLMYIENFTLLMDWKLILRTVTIFFRRDSTEGFGSPKKREVNCPKMRTEPLLEDTVPAAQGSQASKAPTPSQETKTPEDNPEEDNPLRAAL